MEFIDAIAGSNTSQLSDIAEIQNLVFPAEVVAGVDFVVSYDSINKSSIVQHLFGYILDNATGFQVPGSFWEADIATGQMHSVLVTFGGVTEPFNGDAVLGHIEYAECEQITDATECINAGCEWYDGACHSPAPPQCSDYTDPTECINAGCYWYDEACHSTQQGGFPEWAIPVVIAGVGAAIVIAIVAVKKPWKHV